MFFNVSPPLRPRRSKMKNLPFIIFSDVTSFDKFLQYTERCYGGFYIFVRFFSKFFSCFYDLKDIP